MNKFIGIGRVTKDIELKATQNGTQYVQFDLAIDNGKDKDGNERKADFINCTAWEKLAETISVYVHKGNRIAVEGSMKTDKYQNERGENRYKTYILVRNIEFLESKPKDNYEPQEPDYVNKTSYTKEEVDNVPIENDPFEAFGDSIEVNDSDLPF